MIHFSTIKGWATSFLSAALISSQCCFAASGEDVLPASSSKVFTAGMQEGLIGITEETPIDNPADNLFHIALDEALCGDEQVFLVYELEGVEDHTAVSRSINDGLALGGYLVKKRAGWSLQREQLDPASLKQGDNVIRFSLPEGAAHSYKVRRLSLEVVAASAQNTAASSLVINQPQGYTYSQDQVYLKGFVPEALGKGVRLRIEGMEVPLRRGAFEVLVSLKDKKKKWKVEVEAVFPDGEVVCRQLEFKEGKAADFSYELAAAGQVAQKWFSPGQIGSVALEGAQLQIPAGALKTAAPISITSLREVDIPALDAGMVNVTKGHKGFRFLPHGSAFGQALALQLAYDECKIPEGYTAKDIKTYFFDETSHHWVPLAVDSVLEESSILLSRTTHFTDMINAIIQVPESPEAQAYNSTTMKGIKAANPTAAVNLISPPSANNTGNASMGYPINLPAGRQGMQPQLAINYNSGGGNSWLGLGWNMNIPAITVDTRWGVPQYHPSNETETYSFNGEQLSPVAHREELQPRTGIDKQFYPRVEGSFNKIIRHGDKPDNYWWEVTDKSGTKYFYGGNSASERVEETAVLRDNEAENKGKVAHWALREVRDVHGNFIRYHYSKVAKTGLPDNKGVTGHDLYISKITYTGHGQTEGNYSVHFSLDDSLRTDVTINARYGFKRVSADRLKKIAVKYKGSNGEQSIRHYELAYQEGAFRKSLLKSITEFDAAGKEFNTHSFEYYDEISQNGTLIPFSGEQHWGMESDRETFSDLFSAKNEEFTGKVSFLSGTRSSSINKNLRVGLSFDAKLWVMSKSFGVSVGSSKSNSSGIVTLLDINGDNLPDKIFIDKENRMWYRPSTSVKEGKGKFGDPIRIEAPVPNFYMEESKGLSGNFTAQWPSLFASAGHSRSKSTTSVYFSDVNGDQLPDLVSGSAVYFNVIDSVSGQPTFTLDSHLTASPVAPGVAGDKSLFPDESGMRDSLIDQNPLHDMVRLWQAPFSGRIKVEAPVQLLSPESRDMHPEADGVNVAIQLENKELWSSRIYGNDFSEHSPTKVQNISVNKGDRLYFRLQSVENGLDDSVHWAPTIQYLNQEPATKDVNGKPKFVFSAEEDYVVSGKQEIGVPYGGTLKVDGTFVKPQTSDDITIKVVVEKEGKPEEVAIEKTLKWNEQGSYSLEDSFEVDSLDIVKFRVQTSSNIDWSAIEWQPHLYCSAINDPGLDAYDSIGKPVQSFYPVPEFSLFSGIRRNGGPFMTGSNQTENVEVLPEFAFGFKEEDRPKVNGTIYVLVKKVNELISRKELQVVSGTVAESSLSASVPKGDSIYIEYYYADSVLQEYIVKADARLKFSGKEKVIQPAIYYYKKDTRLGPLYRGWGHFAYNGNRDRAEHPINQHELDFSKSITEAKESDYKDKSPEELEGLEGFDPAAEKFAMLMPIGENLSWNGLDDLTRLTATSMQSSRLGLDEIPAEEDEEEEPVTISKGYGYGINKISISNNTSVSGGGGMNFGAIGANASANYSFGPSKVVVDFMDMNGDGYPDIVTPDKVQYSNSNGGLSTMVKDYGFGDNHRSFNQGWGVSLSGNYVYADTKPKIYSMTKNTGVHVGNGSTGAGLSGDYGKGSSETNYTFMDINGDGLPDRLSRDGDTVYVQLNLGYRFAGRESWGIKKIQDASSISYGGGLGVDIKKGSISAGISLSRSENTIDYSLQDVNADGLVDLYYLEGTGKGKKVYVRFNNGNGFDTAKEWVGATAIGESRTASQSVNAAFTAGIILPTPKPMSIKFNPSLAVGKSVSRDFYALRDVNGDGYPDFLSSNTDDELKVKHSTIGRTNLLKSVQRPLGASFTLAYEQVGNTYEMPNAAWVLNEVTVADGHTGDGVDTLRTSFAYEEGYYDRHERDFYGFGKVVTRNHDTSEDGKNAIYTELVQTFNNKNYYEKGLLLEEQLSDGPGQPYVKKVNAYTLFNAKTGKALPEFTREDDPERAFPALEKTQQHFYEGNADAGKSTEISFKYDSIGNVTTINDLGDITNAEDNLTATVKYHYLGTQHITGMPEFIEVKGGDKTYRKREADIYDNGQVKEIRQFLNDEEASVTNLQYDAYGNLKKIINPENEQGQRMEVSYTYDNQVHSYVESVTNNSYGYSSSASYDFRFGQLLKSIDINGHEISYQLDELGRVKQILGPYEKAAGREYTIMFDYHLEAATPYALTRHYDPSYPDNDMETATFVDGLGRVLQTKKDIAVYQKGGADKEMMVVSGHVKYDAFGRAVEAYYPITEDKGGLEVTGKFNRLKDEEVQKPSTTTYDVLGRATLVTLPDGAKSETVYGFGADRNGKLQFSTRSIDPNEIATEQFTDVRGRVTAVKNAGDVWTSFVYNAIGEQVEAINDLGHATVSEYDLLGRRKSREHPDAGLTKYQYDLAGNLIALTTANLREASAGAIQNKYDYNRLTNIDYPQNPENNVTYTYGKPGAAHNRAGRIERQEDATGAQDSYYGPLGEVVKNTRTIVIPQHGEQTYTTEWDYDTWNRLTGMVYPDGEKVEYTYNVGGLLHSMKGKKKGSEYNYVEQLGYDKFEQRVYLAYGNGTKTTYEYEPERRRLHNMVAKTASGRAMMDNIYEYDKVNNIKSLVNNAPVPTSSLMGGSSEYHYDYDDLYRLTDATGSFKGSTKEHRYSLSMSYNTVGGIESKAQTHERKGGDEWKEEKKTTYSQSYEYGQQQPNAPIHIGEQAYTYDPNGNQTGWTHDVSGQRRQILWDEENRIRTIYDNGEAFHYTYDASGERVLKGRSSGQSVYVNNEHKGGSGNMGNYTVYVNPYIVLKSGGYSKHYYIEGQRIVSKLGHDLGDASKGQKAGGDGTVNYPEKQEQSREGIVRNLKFLGQDGALLTAGNSGKTPPGQIIGDGTDGGGGKGGNGGGGKDTENFQYYYHPDHLGSSSYITDASGEVYQHLEYFAFGETFVEEHSNTDRTPYLYNGKELDEETGLYYYGARYYDPRTSVFPSVDPLAEDYAFQSAYAYAANNPVKYVDYMGLGPTSTHTDMDGNVIAVFDDGDLGVYRHNGDSDAACNTIGENYSATNTSAGGEKMGTSLHTFSFVDGGELEDGNIVPRGHINFKSNWAKTSVQWGIDHSIGIVNYGLNAGNGELFDLKERAVSQGRKGGFYSGSIIFSSGEGNVYASARDAGNFLAGAKAGKSFFSNDLMMYGFGAFNASGNSIKSTPFTIAHDGVIRMSGGALLQQPHFGEDRQSGLGIRAGMSHHDKFSGHWLLWNK